MKTATEPSGQGDSEGLHADTTASLKDEALSGPLWVTVKFEEAVLAIIMAALGVITMVNVLTRYVIDFSFAFTEEYSILLLQIMVMAGISAAIAKNGHIRMTFFVDCCRSGTKRWLALLSHVAMLICFCVLVYYGTLYTIDSWALEETSPGMGHPQWLYLMWLPILSTAAALRIVGSIVRLISSILGRVSGR